MCEEKTFEVVWLVKKNSLQSLFFRLHNKGNECERERERENLTIERWVCACFYTCFTVVSLKYLIRNYPQDHA